MHVVVDWEKSMYTSWTWQFVCNVPRMAVVIISLHVQANDKRHGAGFHKHKIEPKYIYIRLEMFPSTYLSVTSLKMDIFRQQITWTSQGRRCIFHKVGVFSQDRRMGYPAWQLSSSHFIPYILIKWCFTASNHIDVIKNRNVFSTIPNIQTNCNLKP